MATAFAPAIAKSLSIIYSLLFFTLLYSTLSIVSPEIPGNAAFSAYPRGYAFKTVFPLRLYCFSWYFGTTACVVSHDPFINFFHPVFHFSGRSGMLRCVSGEDIAKNSNKKRASRPSCARNTGRLVLLCGSCWGVLSESGS